MKNNATNFYGELQICPINNQPFELTTYWEYRDGIWYGNGQSFPEEISKIKVGDLNGLSMHQNK